MSTLALTPAARTAALAAARPAILQALIAYADSGAGPSRLQIYGTTRPAVVGDPAGGDPLVTMTLTDPAGAVVSGVIALTQASVIGDLIMTNGAAVWGRWETSAGDVVADGDVTDMAGAGPFKLDGADGVNLNAGGRAILGSTALS